MDSNDPVIDEYKLERRRELLDLRERISNSPPGPEIDAEIFKTIGNGSNEFVEVTRTVIDHVDGQEDRRTEEKLLFGWNCESDGYFTENGETSGGEAGLRNFGRSCAGCQDTPATTTLPTASHGIFSTAERPYWKRSNWKSRLLPNVPSRRLFVRGSETPRAICLPVLSQIDLRLPSF
jgi:hypothetical protein